MGYRIQDLTAATVLTPATDLLEFQQLSQSAPTSRKVTLAQLLASTLQPANNLSDIVSATSARTNLGLGSAATQASSAFDAAGAAAAALVSATALVTAETTRAEAAEVVLSRGVGIYTVPCTAVAAGNSGADLAVGNAKVRLNQLSVNVFYLDVDIPAMATGTGAGSHPVHYGINMAGIVEAQWLAWQAVASSVPKGVIMGMFSQAATPTMFPVTTHLLGGYDITLSPAYGDGSGGSNLTLMWPANVGAHIFGVLYVGA
jgi:hypothetical protein